MAVGAQINTRLGAVNPEEAAAKAWTYMELLLHSLKMSLQSTSAGKNTGQSLMKPHGPEFQPEITELSCLLYLRKDVRHRGEISRVLHKPEL